jgi:hypothetical protein
MNKQFAPPKPFYEMNIHELKKYVFQMKKKYPAKKLKRRKKRTRCKIKKSLKFKNLTKKNKKRYLRLRIKQLSFKDIYGNR